MQYWKEGADAFDNGIASDENPYQSGSHPHMMWENGWHDAWYEWNKGRFLDDE